MSDPFTTVLTTTALTEGVKFLYGQAGELIKRWRERQSTIATEQSQDTEAITVVLPHEAFDGQLTDPKIHYLELDQLYNSLKDLIGRIAPYVIDPESISLEDVHLIESVDALRQALEVIFHQRITFIGEQRPPSGPVALGEIDVEQVKGIAAGIIARNVSGNAHLAGSARVKVVESDGKASGVIIESIQGSG